MAEVELLPWVHVRRCLAHKNLIDYIRTIPKDSLLALEVNPQRLERLMAGKRLVEKSAYKHYLRLTVSKSYRHVYDMELAWKELLHECRRRNIRIIPISTPDLDKMQTRAQRKGDVKIEVESYIKAEKNYLREIETTAQKSRGKIYVVTGLGHSPPLDSGLEQRRIKSRIQTEIFAEKEKIEQLIELTRKQRKAFEVGDAAKMNEMEGMLRATYNSMKKKRFLGKLGSNIALRHRMRKGRKMQRRAAAAKIKKR